MCIIYPLKYPFVIFCGLSHTFPFLHRTPKCCENISTIWKNVIKYALSLETHFNESLNFNIHKFPKSFYINYLRNFHQNE